MKMRLPCLFAAALLIPFAASAQKHPANDEGCMQITSAYLTGNEKRLDWFPEIPKWKEACERHPDIGQCRESNDAIRRGREFEPLKCVGARG